MAVNALNIGSVDLPGRGYLPIDAFSLPDTAGLEACFLFGQGRELALKNYAPGKPDAALVGDLIAHEGYITLPNLSYIQTEAAETEQQTILIVGRERSAGSVGWIGTFVDGNNVGVSLYTTSNSTSLTGNVGRGNGDPTSGTVTSDTSAWGLYTLQVPASGAFYLRNFTGGAVVASANTGGRLVVGSEKYRIGRLFVAGFSEAIDVAGALIYSRHLTLDELTPVMHWLRTYVGKHGVIA